MKKTACSRHHTVEMEEGAGAKVHRLMPAAGLLNFDPFVLCDHFQLKEGMGFPDHPHRGFEGITYLLSGSMSHTDNLGNAATVSAGGAQRFTAGSGLTHSEMPDPATETQGIQLWVNLPSGLKAIDPTYQQADAPEIPQWHKDGATIRRIVGKGAPLEVKTPMVYEDVTLEEGAVYHASFPPDFRGFVYVVKGHASVCNFGISAHEACLLDRATELEVSALAPSRIIVCFGRPHGEPIIQRGPYVD